MKVKELIEILSKIKDQEQDVMVEGYEDGFDDIEQDSFVECGIDRDFYSDDDKLYYGRHQKNPKSKDQVIVIKRQGFSSFPQVV